MSDLACLFAAVVSFYVMAMLFSLAQMASKLDRLDKKLAEHLALDDRYEHKGEDQEGKGEDQPVNHAKCRCHWETER